ncbi:MAG TPA: acyl-homoserine-lactone synthase [Caulobacteraceae bacterium]|nr:acyl-homoserine-lactone synthase [Caulobacteraceae bacterium]
MLHIVTAANRHLYRRQLEAMHRQRYELFVKGRGWNLAVRDGGEYDEGDDERAVYLLGIDESGYCHSSIRARPADDFSYVIDAMPEWIEGGAQRLRENPNLWEMARWISQGEDRATGEEIRIGLIEYLLTREASECIACGDLHITAYALRAGWRLKFLGIPRTYPEGGVAVATSLPITQEEVEHARELTGRRDLFLMEVDPAAPWSELPLPVIEGAFRTAAAEAEDYAALARLADQLLRASLSGGRAA